MLAKQYEQQMIEDDARDGLDSGQSNFRVIVDQKAEQDYAINTFKGSGEMSEIFDQNAKEEKKSRQQQIAQKIKELQALQQKEASKPTAEKGDQLINSGDAEAMYEFSAAVASDAGQ